MQFKTLLTFCLLFLSLGWSNRSAAHCNLEITGSKMVCMGNIETYSSNDTSNNQLWMAEGGIIIGSSTGKTVKIKWLRLDSTFIRLHIQNSLCDTFVLQSIYVQTFKFTQLESVDTTCGASLYLFNLRKYPYYGSKYEWKLDGVTIEDDPFDYDKSSVSIKLKDTGLAKISVKISNSGGCDTTIYKTIVLRPKARPVINGPVNVCPHSGPHMYYVAPNKYNRYEWFLKNGIVIGPKNSNVINIFWLDEAEVLLAVKEVVADGCFGYYPLNIFIGHFETTISSKILSSCLPATVNFEAEGNVALDATYWDFGDGKTSSGASVLHTYNKAGNYKIKAYNFGLLDCADTAYATITIPEMPKADFNILYPDGKDFAFNLEDTVRLLNNSTGAARYYWDFGDGFTDSVINTSHSYQKAGTYFVMLKSFSDSGCIDSVVHVINVKGRSYLYIPNAFSPNADTLNDEFFVKSINISSLNIQIYNRWGEMIFSSGDTNFKWNGKFKGETVPDGLYFYNLTAKDFSTKNIYRKGTIYITK